MIFCFNVHARLYKMNEIVNKFLLAGDKFMPEMHLKRPGFTYSACGPFTKNKERIQKFEETGDTSYTYKIEPDKACFHHDMKYGDFKDIARKTASDKVLRVQHLILLKILNMMGIKEGLPLWFINVLIKSPLRFQINLHQAVVLLIMRLNKIFNQLKNYKNQLLENFEKEKFILDLKIIFGVLI